MERNEYKTKTINTNDSKMSKQKIQTKTFN